MLIALDGGSVAFELLYIVEGRRPVGRTSLSNDEHPAPVAKRVKSAPKFSTELGRRSDRRSLVVDAIPFWLTELLDALSRPSSIDWVSVVPSDDLVEAEQEVSGADIRALEITAHLVDVHGGSIRSRKNGGAVDNGDILVALQGELVGRADAEDP